MQVIELPSLGIAAVLDAILCGGHRDRSSSASRLTAGDAGFFIFTQRTWRLNTAGRRVNSIGARAAQLRFYDNNKMYFSLPGWQGP
jgi:hypothetical protein